MNLLFKYFVIEQKLCWQKRLNALKLFYHITCDMLHQVIRTTYIWSQYSGSRRLQRDSILVSNSKK